MKKAIAILLILALMLVSGCSMVKETEYDALKYDDSQLQQEIDLQPEIKINPILYFLNPGKTRLAAEVREITIPQTAVPEEYVVNALIEGPQSSDLIAFAQKFEFEYIEVLPEVINIYLTLPKNYYMSAQDLLNAKLAFTATLAEFSGKKYINVLIDGKQTGYNGLPTGALEKITTNFSEAYTQFDQKTKVETPDLNTVLYFMDISESYIMPEYRKLVFQNNTEDPSANLQSDVQTIVREMIKGPQNTYNHKPIIDSSIILEGAAIETAPDGSNIIVLDFNKAPIVYTEQFMDAQNMTLAALAYTIINFLPGLDGMQVRVQGAPLENGRIYKPSDYRALVGSNITLYFPNSTYTMLSNTDRVIKQNETGNPHIILSELFKGPSSADKKEIWPAVSSGISIEDLKEIYIANDIAVVDFSPDIQEKMKKIEEQDEYIMIYSIVNTLTSLDGIKRVQFLVDGQRVHHLGGGILDIIDPLMRNPGIILQE